MDKLFKHTLVHVPSPAAQENWIHVSAVSHYRHGADPVPFHRKRAEGYQMFYTVDGMGWLDYAGSYQTIEPGTLTCVSLENPHGFGAVPDQIWEHYWVICGGKAFTDLYRTLFDGGNHVCKVPNPKLAQRHFEELFQLKKSNPLYFDIKAMSCIMQLLSDLAISRTVFSGDSGAGQVSFIEKAIGYVFDNLQQDIGVEDLARFSGYSTWYFSRTFKQHTGFSPGEYIVKTRIEYAKELLSTTDYPLELIAQKCGFHSQNYFISVFRKRESITPGQYRRVPRF